MKQPKNGHEKCANDHSNKGSIFRMLFAVDYSCWNSKGATDDKIGKFTDTGGDGSVNCQRILINSIAAPAAGPIAKHPISTGTSLKSIS